MAFLRNMWKNGKHDKLQLGEKNSLENDFEGDASSTLPESVNFRVKYLGSTIVSRQTAAPTAVDTILNMSKVSKRKMNNVNINVTLNGISVTDVKTGNVILEASVFRISNCSTDPVRSIFTFFAMNNLEITECHAFHCHKKKIALNIALTVANSFRLAYEAWQRGHQVCNNILEEQRSGAEKIRNKSLDAPVQLIDFTEEIDNDTQNNFTDFSNNWVRFENDKDDFNKEVTESSLKFIPPPEQHHRNVAATPRQENNFLDDLAWT